MTVLPMSVPLDLGLLNDYEVASVVRALRLRGDDDSIAVGELMSRHPGKEIEDLLASDLPGYGIYSHIGRTRRGGPAVDHAVLFDGMTGTSRHATVKVRADRVYEVHCQVYGRYDVTTQPSQYGNEMVLPKLQDPAKGIDVLGRAYAVGDRIAVSVINGRSPQLVIGEVTKLAALDSKKEPLSGMTVFDFGPDSRMEILTAQWSVQAMPTVDARGFSRQGDRKVTYRIPENILAIR